MSIIHVLIGLFFVLFAVGVILFTYNDAIAPTYGFPKIWGN